MGCLDEDMVFAFAKGKLDDDSRRQAMSHADSCELCRRLLAVAVDALIETPRDAAGAPIGDDPSPLPRGTTVGRYVVLDRLGQGGMGVVYAAYDSELDRKVALKLLRPDVLASATWQARLSREAQAMARVAHPNVVAVYDVGRVGDRVCIAMEVVDGVTLSSWAREQRRSTNEILEVFFQAGCGLAAAHAAGLVHRDFKPDNALVGRDGRVRVVDFGLARAEDAPAWVGGSAPLSGALTASLTRTGTLLGTPAYMAPEQLAGEQADARSDQFAFCVALYEALYGERPFAAQDAGELAASIAAGRVRRPPRGSRVPAWLREVLLRGLAADPQARFVSMDALLAALARDPARVRRRWLRAAAALAVIAVVAVSVLRARTQQSRMCGRATQKLAGVWDESRRRAVHDAFSATHKPFAEAAFAAVALGIERYLAAWAAMETEACAATRVHGEQSEELMQLRMECLEVRRQQVRALTDLFKSADAQVVQRAAQAVQSLPSLDECENAEALRQVVRPPANAAARAHVAALRTRIAEAEAGDRAGRYRQARKLAEAAASEAQALGYAPVTAEALSLRGDLEILTGDAPAAAQTLLAAVESAEAGRHDHARAQALVGMVYVLGARLARYADAHGYYALARAALARAGGDPLLETRLEDFEAVVLINQARYDEALAIQKRVLARREQLFASSRPTTIASSLVNMCDVYLKRGEPDQAIANFQRALAIYEKTYGPDHIEIARMWAGQASGWFLKGEIGTAVTAWEKSLAILENALGPDHPDVASTLNNLGEAFIRLRQLGKARTVLERAYAIKLRAVGPDHPLISTTEALLGELFMSLGELDVALAHGAHALAIREHALGPEHPDVAEALVLLGKIQLSRHEDSDARRTLERAIAILEHHPSSAEMLADARYTLARALWTSPRERGRARSLAGAAVEHGGLDRAEIAAWLAAHR
jgi:tetratricopeptide (TPR) repeat protein/predicted Ser/Thr protein kinase